MSGAIFSFDESSMPSVNAPCVCHDQSYDSMHRRPKRLAWLPMTARISIESIRPLVNLATLRSQEREGKVPMWSQRPEVDHVSLLRADRWIEEVSASVREPALGLLALADLQRGAGQVVELAAESSDTLGEALLVIAHNVAILNEAASYHLHIEGPAAVLVMESKLLLSHTMRDYLAGAMASLVARWLGSYAGIELWFAGPRPTYALAYRTALPDISFGFHAPCDALVIPAASLHRRLPLADPKLQDFLLRLAQRTVASDSVG
jgi:hypothetical protein